MSTLASRLWWLVQLRNARLLEALAFRQLYESAIVTEAQSAFAGSYNPADSAKGE